MRRPKHRAADPGLVDNVIRTTRAQAGLDPDYFKLWAIGFNKTGTTSLYTLFTKLGFEAMDGPHWRRNADRAIHYQFQTFTDGPPEDFRHLDRTFPNSRFLLNVRALDEWLDSRIEHVRVRLEEPGYKAEMSGGKMPDVATLQRWTRAREAHHRDVLAYFADRPRDLLVIDYIADPEAPAKVAAFVGRDATGIEKPYTRSTEVTRRRGELRNPEMIHRALSGLGVPAEAYGAGVTLPVALPDPSLTS